MNSQIKTLMSQADELRNGIHDLAERTHNYQLNLAGIERCVDTISHCVGLVGNNRVAAIAAKDQRKIMAELESAVEELKELLQR
ncbi:hypothetical protein [Marinobacterium rhizophilum]|uniref:Uncharacterized protein n=1 Tax=Marinobacterium rhizophilum TaxID=420402 RepID=A0ABY5HLG0_9GAMM|nr:hypothetical protein [Marinobacterium rhizophilum]UTW13216.1 hypothetical protein KDW95_06010 [Marinobacterium rhizophilum]